MVKQITASSLVALVVAVAVSFFAPTLIVQTPSDDLGNTVDSRRHYLDGGANILAMGGKVTTFASGSVTFSARNICENSVILQTGNTDAIASAQTNKLPSASSLVNLCLKEKGDTRTLRFENNSVQGSGRFTYGFQLGSGVDVFVASGSAVIAGAGDGVKLRPEAAAIVRFTNINGSSVSVDFIELINAD